MVEGDKGNFVPDNLGFVFVRNADYSVTVYRATETNCSKIVNKFIVKAEDRLDNNDPSTSEWTFDLKWKDACDDADIETFSINGVSGKVNIALTDEEIGKLRRSADALKEVIGGLNL